MATNEKLDLDKDDKLISEKVHQGMIGSLLYVITIIVTSCLVSVYILDFKLPLMNLISHVLKKYILIPSEN